MAFLSGDSLARIENAGPGLQLVTWWTFVAAEASDDARSVLSFTVSGLINRGWVKPLPGTIAAAVDGLDISEERVTAAATELQGFGLMQVEGERITTLAGIFSTVRSRSTFFMSEDQQVHLVGPLAALAASQALGRSGEVLADCAQSEPTVRLRLECDENGVDSRTPDSICAFLADWNGEAHPADAMRQGGLFADDDALAAWQEKHGEPDGMPLMSMMFPIASIELGGQLGKALESLLDRFANYQ